VSTRLLGPLLLLVLWVALQGNITWANLASGVVVVGLVVLWGRRTGRRSPGYRFHPIAALRLLGVFLTQLVRGSFRLATAVLAPTDARMATVVVQVPLEVDRPFIATLLADLISLLPGSVTIGAHGRPARLEVHVMGSDSEAGARADVRRLESLVLATFEPVGAQDDTAEWDAADGRPRG